ncbi:MAG: hypothetical protein N4R20_02755 [Lactobacillus iners]|uniref:hypothetical protein n=1 Tax=Lactobacillus iners TaxID=147802 RepID=UPI001F08CED7|nr:hypothetical protein [Lactobacillus iners]MCT7778220.1 hypothetical protein [Lactobacillus iners]MDK8133963.1 hypothetical protein [Lactobacillus iners]
MNELLVKALNEIARLEMLCFQQSVELDKLRGEKVDTEVKTRNGQDNNSGKQDSDKAK